MENRSQAVLLNHVPMVSNSLTLELSGVEAQGIRISELTIMVSYSAPADVVIKLQNVLGELASKFTAQL